MISFIKYVLADQEEYQGIPAEKIHSQLNMQQDQFDAFYIVFRKTLQITRPMNARLLGKMIRKLDPHRPNYVILPQTGYTEKGDEESKDAGSSSSQIRD